MPGPTGRPRDPDVDVRILDAARALLHESGLERLTISAVASRAGVGRPTVYRRYNRPDDIAMEVLYTDIDGLLDEAEARRNPGAPVLDQLVDLADPFLVYYNAHPPLSAALLKLSMFSGGAWQARFANHAIAWLAGLAADFQTATTDGRLHPDVDTQVLMQTFFGLYLMTAIAGVQGLFDLETQRMLLRRSLAQHLRGLVPE
ncbi:MAG: TetR/AcrR family transcriptional regulator [Myxococcota bacterium]